VGEHKLVVRSPEQGLNSICSRRINYTNGVRHPTVNTPDLQRCPAHGLQTDTTGQF
jgi:hypothetical protein